MVGRGKSQGRPAPFPGWTTYLPLPPPLPPRAPPAAAPTAPARSPPPAASRPAPGRRRQLRRQPPAPGFAGRQARVAAAGVEPGCLGPAGGRRGIVAGEVESEGLTRRPRQRDKAQRNPRRHHSPHPPGLRCVLARPAAAAARAPPLPDQAAQKRAEGHVGAHPATEWGAGGNEGRHVKQDERQDQGNEEGCQQGTTRKQAWGRTVDPGRDQPDMRPPPWFGTRLGRARL